MQLAPLVSVASTILFTFLAFAHLPTKEMQPPLLSLYENTNLQVFWTERKRAQVGNRPVKSSQAQHSLGHACGLA